MQGREGRSAHASGPVSKPFGPSVALSIIGSGGTVEYTLLNSIMEEAGRNSTPPQVLDQAGIDGLVNNGWKQMFRGVKGKQFTDMFKYDATYKEAGSGARLYGEGTYIQTSQSGAKGYGSDVMRMAVDPKAKVVTISTLKKKKAALRAEVYADHNAGKITNNERAKRLDALDDLGRVAALLNYDLIDAQTSGYFVLLNRSMVAVQKDNV